MIWAAVSIGGLYSGILALTLRIAIVARQDADMARTIASKAVEVALAADLKGSSVLMQLHLKVDKPDPITGYPEPVSECCAEGACCCGRPDGSAGCGCPHYA